MKAAHKINTDDESSHIEAKRLTQIMNVSIWM